MNNTAYQGNTYYFSIVLKQEHSDYIMNIYYITVKFSGDVVSDTGSSTDDTGNTTTPNKTFVPTNAYFNLTDITW
jgi:uncharacterized protein (DUF427 family)